jgi:hypothetical protein
MRREEYLDALNKLGLLPCSQKTSAKLGLSVRQLARISSGDSHVPEPVAKLMQLYLKMEHKE